MAYNKAREEKKWLLWKEAEEKRLRDLGVDEAAIQKLRKTDWEQFKSERRYQEHNQTIEAHIGRLATEESEPFISNVQQLLDGIENEGLYHILISLDKLTLQIAVLKMQGYALHEIAKQLKLTDKAVYRRMDRLKEKIKKFNN